MRNVKIIMSIVCLIITLTMSMSCMPNFDFLKNGKTSEEMIDDIMREKETSTLEDIKNIPRILSEDVYLDNSMKYATFSVINFDKAVLYKQNIVDVVQLEDVAKNYPNIESDEFIDNYMKNITRTVCVNAGHGTKGGSVYKTFSHPDFSPKVAGGTTAKDSILSSAISDGTVLNNKMTEADANLLIAAKFKDKLLDMGYNVLMIRENNDAKLDNIARTVIANTYADIHIAIHFDSTSSDKGIFYITPMKDPAYINMEPLKSNIENVILLGNSIIEAFREMGQKIWNNTGMLAGDLTQLSFSTIPSCDIELGDKMTEVNENTIEMFANGLVYGVEKFFINYNG